MNENIIGKIEVTVEEGPNAGDKFVLYDHSLQSVKDSAVEISRKRLSVPNNLK